MAYPKVNMRDFSAEYKRNIIKHSIKAKNLANFMDYIPQKRTALVETFNRAQGQIASQESSLETQQSRARSLH